MAPEGLLLAALLLTFGVLLLAALRLLKLHADLRQLDADLNRALAAGRQQAERVARLEQLREAQATASEVIAASSSVVRDVHESIIGGVYGAIAGLNRAVGRELRRSRPPGDDDASKPVGPADSSSRELPSDRDPRKP